MINTTKVLKPTDSELEILHVLWQKDKATVREVHEDLMQTKDCGYTTTLKLMQIMFDKGLVLRDDTNRTHIYKANVTREKTQKQLVDKMVRAVFSGSHSQLVMQALGSHTPSKTELDEIQHLLDSYKK
ncbi:MAG: BlaI/MecI/CopY family transcriptional regulator [Parafilimonas sp.]